MVTTRSGHADPCRVTPDDPGFNALERLALLAILALALWLRLRDIGLTPLWMDELATRAYLDLPWAAMFGEIVWLEPTPPGYYVLVKLLAPLVGAGDAALRLPSALAGTLALLPLAFHLRRVAGTTAALAGAALLAVWVVQIAYSQEARAYGVLFLACATALWLHARILRGEIGQPLLASIGFGLLCAAMLYLHATAIFFIGALTAKTLVAVALRPTLFRRLAAAHVVAGVVTMLLALPWFAIIFGIATDPRSAMSWMRAPDTLEALGIIGSVLGAHQLGALGFAVSGAMLALMAVGTVSGLERRDADTLGNAAAFGFAACGLYIVSQSVPVMLERTSLTLVLFAIPLAVQGLVRLRPPLLGCLVFVALLASQIVALTMRDADRAQAGRNEDWSGAVTTLARDHAGEPVLILGGFEIAALPHYAPGLQNRAAIRSVSSGAERLSAAVARNLPYAGLFREEEICALSQAGRLGFWSLGREDMAQLEVGMIERALSARGARLERVMDFGLVRLRRWSAPDCAGAAAR